jgi:formylglycine-generating enzyme required for sulfatase activity
MNRWFLPAVLAAACTLPLLGCPGHRNRVVLRVGDGLIAEMKFVHVPKGTFWMGWDSTKKQSKQVEIKEDFELAAYTVTQGQWQEVLGANPSNFSRNFEDSLKDTADADLERFPVEMVSWDDAQKFLTKLNEREQGKGWIYRLPKEAEWEYGCRNAASSKEECSFDFYFEKGTNDLSSTQANFVGARPAGNAAKGPYLGRPTKVGSYAANKLGLYDMYGNVWQWCEDLWDEKGPGHVIRGGAWNCNGQSCRAAYRSLSGPAFLSSSLGLRLARVPSASK